MANHAGNAQPALGYHAVRIKMPAMKIRVSHDRPSRNLVESDVFGRQIGRAGDDHGVAQAIGVLQSPAQCLHAAQGAPHHGRQRLNAQGVHQPRLRVNPIFDRDHGKVGSVDPAGVWVHMHGPGRAKAGTKVVHADDKEFVGVQGLARTNHVVPPALGFFLPQVGASHMVRRIQGMADQHRVGFVGVEHPVGLKAQRIVAQ